MRITKRKLAALLAVAIVCISPKFASAYFYGSGDYSSNSGGCDGAGNYGGYFWCDGYYAWYYGILGIFVFGYYSLTKP